MPVIWLTSARLHTRGSDFIGIRPGVEKPYEKGRLSTGSFAHNCDTSSTTHFDSADDGGH
jgi:hypothetical protein